MAAWARFLLFYLVRMGFCTGLLTKSMAKSHTAHVAACARVAAQGKVLCSFQCQNLQQFLTGAKQVLPKQNHTQPRENSDFLNRRYTECGLHALQWVRPISLFVVWRSLLWQDRKQPAKVGNPLPCARVCDTFLPNPQHSLSTALKANLTIITERLKGSGARTMVIYFTT